jgi:glycosyltransferase involved in cell wall biosynthesis
VKEILTRWERVSPEKVKLIHHGFDLSYFQQVDLENISKMKLRLGFNDEKKLVIGIIARYTEWKGIQFTIQAFNKIKDQFPDAYLILANAHGDYSREIKERLAQLPDNSYAEIAFENDLSSLYKLFDVFVHVPTDRYAEAFGQTYVEALASGIPSVFTLSGVACEFVQDKVNALVVDYQNVEEIVSAVSRILQDTLLRDKLIREGSSIVKKFELNGMLNKLEKLYE